MLVVRIKAAAASSHAGSCPRHASQASSAAAVPASEPRGPVIMSRSRASAKRASWRASSNWSRQRTAHSAKGSSSSNAPSNANASASL